MLKKKTSIIIISVLFFTAFFMQTSSIYDRLIYFLSDFINIRADFLIYAAPQIMFWVAMIAGMIIAFKSYLNTINGLKIFVSLVLVTFIDYFSIMTFNVLLILVCDSIIVPILIGLYFWYNKM